MMFNSLKYIATGAALSIFSIVAYAQPECLTAFDEPEFAFAAGCLVRSGDRMLMVRHRFGGKLGFPAGGANAGESAQCVAHRETWEETGVAVVVHGLIRRLGTGLALYRCELVDPDLARSDELAVPRSGMAEISEVVWLDPRATDAAEWRFPRDYPIIIDIFQKAE